MTNLEYNTRLTELEDKLSDELAKIESEYDEKYSQLDDEYDKEIEKIVDKHNKLVTALDNKFDKEKESEEKNKADRHQEVIDAYNKYKELSNKFADDYDDYVMSDNCEKCEHHECEDNEEDYSELANEVVKFIESILR